MCIKLEDLADTVEKPEEKPSEEKSEEVSSEEKPSESESTLENGDTKEDSTDIEA